MFFAALLLSSSISTPLYEEPPLLLVRVVEDFGADLEVTWKEERLGMWNEEKWPKEPHLVVIPKRTGPEEAHLERTTVQGESAQSGVIGFLLEPGREYFVGVYGRDIAFLPEVVSVSAKEGKRQLTLVAHRRELVAFESGLEFTDTKSLIIEDARTGIVLIDRGMFGRLPKALPGGLYRVHFQDAPSFDMHGLLLRRATRGRKTTMWDSSTGPALVMDGSLAAGATLTVEVRGKPSPQDRIAFEKSPESGEINGPGFDAATITLVPDVGHSVYVRFPVESDKWPGEVVDLTSRIDLGLAHVSEPVPTGAFTLVARMPDGRVAMRAVQLDAHEQELVILDLPTVAESWDEK